MKIPISRQALENSYKSTLKPFLESFSEMVKEFQDMFAVISLPDISLELLDDLDSSLMFNVWEFCEKQSLSFEIEVQIHFNHYDFDIEWYIDNCDFESKVKLAYDQTFSKQEQKSLINKTGKAIIAKIRSEF